jgi:hypothetical protein
MDVDYRQLLQQYMAEHPDRLGKPFDGDMYYDLMGWYDDLNGTFDIDGYSAEAMAFASYASNGYKPKQQPEPTEPRLLPQHNGLYAITNLSQELLDSLVRMVNSACLPERRDWFPIKKMLEAKKS